MQQKKLKLSAVILLGLGLTGLQAQEAIPATGGNASGSGGSASYSVGQIVYTTNTGTNASVAQGVQQPYEISIITGIEVRQIKLMLSAYPNPTTDFLQLKVEGDKVESLSYQLYVIQGKLLESNLLTSRITAIETGKLPTSTYFLKVINNNKLVKTFKIIKN